MSVGEARRDIRYQAAILEGSSVLMLRYDPPGEETFWMLPGGGREPGESELDCVEREVLEETCLPIRVQRQLSDQPAEPGGVYDSLRTFLCVRISGDARAGFEPDVNGIKSLVIEEVRWIDLQDEATWPPELFRREPGANMLRRIRSEVFQATD